MQPGALTAASQLPCPLRSLTGLKLWVPTHPAPSLPQARLAEAQAATARADRLQGESAELVRRIIEMKDREADRLNEMNRLHTETVGCVCETGGFN